jgi:hypothetical protein
LKEAFDAAIKNSHRSNVVALLIAAGVDAETAANIVAKVLPK